MVVLVGNSPNWMAYMTAFTVVLAFFAGWVFGVIHAFCWAARDGRLIDKR
jgi:hypothetical protein